MRFHPDNGLLLVHTGRNAECEQSWLLDSLFSPREINRASERAGPILFVSNDFVITPTLRSVVK